MKRRYLVNHSVIGAVLLSLAGASSVVAQSRPGAGVLRELQGRLLQTPGVEVWEEARRLPSAKDAAPLMEHLAGRAQDPLYAARAALWLGHYHYGAGQIEAALQYFKRAAAVDDSPAVRPEAAFWTAQCRNLLGMAAETTHREPDVANQPAFFTRLAELDGRLRLGDLDGALRGYLSLEGVARRLQCLAPLYYRLGLIHHAGGVRGSVDASMTRAWASSVSGSAERALVAVLDDGAASRPRRDDPPRDPDFTEPSAQNEP